VGWPAESSSHTRVRRTNQIPSVFIILIEKQSRTRHGITGGKDERTLRDHERTEKAFELFS
jgi:hypothetical protein